MFRLIILITLCLVLTGCGPSKATDTTTPSSVSQTAISGTDLIQLAPLPKIPPAPLINQDQSLSIASKYIPPELNQQNNLSIGYDYRISQNGSWRVTVSVPTTIIVTKEQLLGVDWEESDFNGTAPPFKTLIIFVDAVTGNIIRRLPIGINSLQIGPSSPPLISPDTAKIMISKYVPADILDQARIISVPSQGAGIYAYFIYLITNISSGQLDWQNDSRTHLDKLSPGQQYFELVICVDASTGELIKRAAFVMP